MAGRNPQIMDDAISEAVFDFKTGDFLAAALQPQTQSE
jgi:hypothetical protein